MKMPYLAARRHGLTALLLSAALGTTALAQTVDDTAIPDTGLNIPKNLQIYGKRDPNVRKPTAIVNETVITGTDVDHRVALVIAANTEVALTDAVREQIRNQVVGQLIDETLQLQEAKTADIKVSAQEIDQSLGNVAKRLKLSSVAELRAYLRQKGSSERTLRRQIEADIAWQRYLRRRIDPFVNVSDDDVRFQVNSVISQKGAEEFRIAEIYLRATPDQAAQVAGEARALMQEIQQGKRRFDEVARARSDSTTAATGGDLGWVTAGQLPESLAQATAQMSVNQIAGPIEVPGGFSVIYLIDRRRILTADPRDAVLSLRQIGINFPKGLTEAEAGKRVSDFARATQGIRGCGDAKSAVKSIGAEVVDNDAVRVGDLPEQLQGMLLKMQVGEITQPFGSPDTGVRVLVLCGREEPKEAAMPSMEQMRNAMEQKAVNLRAEHKLRDLRRDAIIEYR